MTQALTPIHSVVSESSCTESPFFFWIDLEMTGLDPAVDSILEVGVVITDLELKPLEEYEQVVYQPPTVLESMNAFCQKLHGDNGLTARVPQGKPLLEVERELMKLAGKYFPPSERIVLCGNSVGNDRRFIQQYWKKLETLLHYRLIDVSSFKEVLRRKYQLQFKKKRAHRAIEDIHESIQELSYYLSFFRSSISRSSISEEE